MSTFLQLFLKRGALRRITRWALSLIVLAAVATGGWAIYQRLAVPQVVVTEVVTGPVVQAFYATGTLSPYREYQIRSNVEGILVEVMVDKGAEVQKGQTVARVYVEEFLLKRKQAEADLELAKELAESETSPVVKEFDARIRATEKQRDTAKREYDRLVQLRESGGRTATQLDQAMEVFKTAEDTIASLQSLKATKILELARDVKTAEAQLDIAEWNIDQQSITSPITGVVLDWPTATGTRVRVNDLIMTVADVRYDQLVMRTQVDEEDKTRVGLDQTVHITLYSYPNRVFEGKVTRIYPKADPTRRTFEVDVAMLEPDAGFSAGMTGELAFVVDRKDEAVVVPSQAVQNGQVWTIKNRRLEPIDVELGLRSIERTQILSGVSPGDTVVISPIGKLTPGQEVRTTSMDPTLAAGLNVPKEKASQFKGLK